jgi:hypothetical protein
MALRADAERHQDIDAARDLEPLRPDGTPAIEVEGPALEPGRPRAAIEDDAAQRDCLVVEIGDARQQLAADLGKRLEAPVVVAGDQELVWVGKRSKPAVERPQFVHLAVARHVAGVDEDVAMRNNDPVVHAVCIADGDDPHPHLLRAAVTRSPGSSQSIARAFPPA